MTLKHILTTLLILIVALFTTNSNSNTNNTTNNDCIFIKGGGFSGFWYYYGYLQKNNMHNKTIYCYSSGCVAYVASIKYTNEKYLYELALANRLELDHNNISKYDLKERFISIIATNISTIQNYNLNILTTNYAGECIIKKPASISELIVALDETTNIPLITTKLNFSKNFDGGMCIRFINKCANTITLPYDYKIYSNIFNIYLNYEDIIYFLNYNL